MFFQIIFIQIRFLAPMCFKLMQLNFIFSAILQYSVVIGSSQVPFKWFTLQSWHIWWSLLNEIKKKNRRNILGPVNKTSRPFFLNFFSNFCLLCDLQHQFCLLLLLAHWHSLTNDSICCSVGTQLRRPRPPSFSSFGFVNISRRLLDIVQAVINGKRVHRLLPMSFVSDWHDTRNFEFFRRFQVILHFWDTIL